MSKNFSDYTNLTELFTALGRKLLEFAHIYVGTTDEWNQKTVAQKTKFNFAAFTDDSEDSEVDDVPTEDSEHLVKSGGVYEAIQAIKPTYLSATLSAGSTSVTFTDLPTENDYAVDFFASDGSAYESIDASVEGQVTVNYAVSGSSRTIKCRLERI